MLADTCGALTKALGLELDLSSVLGTVRCKRFSMMVEDGTVTKINVEADGTGLTCSLAQNIQ
jgi:2-Cys peroxiredoxin 5